MVAPWLKFGLLRVRLVTVAALACLLLLAWAWLVAGAGMTMDPLVSLAPLGAHEDPHPAAAMAATWSPVRLGQTAAMWWVMMVAMMLPSAAPVILLYVSATAHPGALARYAAESFLGGYLAAWGAFSLGIATLQLLLESAYLLDPTLMASASPWFSAALLFTAGLYQLSPFMDRCLIHCRNPAQFLSREFRIGRACAFRMGVLHGRFCIGCCWPLMALLFVGGVMNLAWIALLTCVVAAEKLLPSGRYIAVVLGLGFIAWSMAVLLPLLHLR